LIILGVIFIIGFVDEGSTINLWTIGIIVVVVAHLAHARRGRPRRFGGGRGGGPELLLTGRGGAAAAQEGLLAAPALLARARCASATAGLTQGDPAECRCAVAIR